MKEEWFDPNRSLMEKYQSAMDTLYKDPVAGAAGTFTQKATPVWFLMTVFTGHYMVYFVFLPVIYDDEWTLCFHRIYFTFAMLQILANMFMTRYVTSFYQPSQEMIQDIGRQAEFSLKYVELQSHEDNLQDNTDVSLTIGEDNWPRSNGTGDASVGTRGAWTPMMVQVASVDEVCQGKSRRENFPYWSWKPCLLCDHQRPPRSHHCPLCKGCILKRDHHCFMTNSCVGLRNQRFFTMMTFWAFHATSYAIYLSILYIPNKIDNYLDLILPITIIRWIFGYLTLSTFFYLVLLLLCLYSVIMVFIQSVFILIGQINLITKGCTSFEVMQNFKLTNTGKKMNNIRGVLGSYPLLGLLIPYIVFPCQDDGIRWPHIKT